MEHMTLQTSTNSGDFHCDLERIIVRSAALGLSARSDGLPEVALGVPLETTSAASRFETGHFPANVVVTCCDRKRHLDPCLTEVSATGSPRPDRCCIW